MQHDMTSEPTEGSVAPAPDQPTLEDAAAEVEPARTAGVSRSETPGAPSDLAEGAPLAPSPADGDSPRAQSPTERPRRTSGRAARSSARGAGRNAGVPVAPSPISQGDELEVRFARMLFWQGSFSRRAINLQRHFHPEPLLITDLDLLAVTFSPQLQMVRAIGEAKSGTGKSAARPLDRAIWLAGLMPLVGAERAHLVTGITPSRTVRETARSLRVHAIGEADLAEWEARSLTPATLDVGSHGPSAWRLANETHLAVRGDPELERMYWFLRSEVWFLEPWQALKRTIGALQRIRREWTPEIADQRTSALRWLYAEALSVFTLNLVAIIGHVQEFSARDMASVINQKLAEGAVPAHQMAALATSFDRYLARVVREAGGDNVLIAEALGAFHPTPPDWAEQLRELVSRLLSVRNLGALPRYMDLVIHERLVHRRHVNPDSLRALQLPEGDDLSPERRLIAAFLRSCVDLPEPVQRALAS